MPAISLRDEDPPDDAVVVVRGGSMHSDFVVRTASDTHDEFGIFAISIFLAMDETVERLGAREPFLARYSQVRLSSVGRLKGGGFALLPTLGRPNYDVVLPDLSDATLERLESRFDRPIPNPGRT